jgi:periplasmic protein TonB
MSVPFDDQEEDPGFFRRNRVGIGIGVVIVLLAGGAALALVLCSGKVPPPRKIDQIVIHLQPPPPLPPPPPPPPPPKIPPPPEKMVEQPPVLKPEEKPKNEPKAPDKPPGPPAVAASGPPSDFGVGGSGGGGGDGDGAGGGGSKYGWYFYKVQTAIQQALERNATTRVSKFHQKVRIWADASGRIERSKLAGSTGDPALDAAINDALTGTAFPEAPPDGLTMPLVLMINGK